MWFEHPEFSHITERIWDRNPDYFTISENYKNYLIRWNKETFGNIFRRKRKILYRIKGIHQYLQHQYSKSLFDLEKELQQEYVLLLEQENFLERILSG